MREPEKTNPTLVELLQSQVECLQEELRKTIAHNEHLSATRVETDRDLPPIARTEANFWKAKFFEASAELAKSNKGIRRLRDSRERLQTRFTLLKERVALAEEAMGFVPGGSKEASRLCYEESFISDKEQHAPADKPKD